jgi:hypothetical protein
MIDCFKQGNKRRLLALMSDSDFAQAKACREQIAIACQHHREFDGEKRFTEDVVARFMRIKSGATIESQTNKPFSSTGQPGRLPLLPGDAQSPMIEFVQTLAAEHNPGKSAELVDDLDDYYQIILSGHSLRHIVRSMTTLESVAAMSKDSDRVGLDAVAYVWRLRWSRVCLTFNTNLRPGTSKAFQSEKWHGSKPVICSRIITISRTH